MEVSSIQINVDDEEQSLNDPSGELIEIDDEVVKVDGNPIFESEAMMKMMSLMKLRVVVNKLSTCSSKMRGKGCKGGSSYRGSSDSLHSIALDAPAQVTSAPNVLSQPLPPFVANACAGSSSSSASTPCASGGVTPNGEPTMHARDTPTSSMDCLPLTIDESRRPRIKLVNGMLHPSYVCARKITFIFKERMDENGYSWKNISKETKNFYWNEFQVD
ncbi:uncharacterized protein LOC120267324 [Dioscorea cayenensis subsp. rotundata]|uniref:Uncharacterized protein LOC120267324 n=1 Tax=Dioscorea cayennensis subsp. rotundata TaxID=55577 RepID=A0AB40BUX4_DIOCR|nr:uncharacterized protein LOC120267324 [Dioscorea cayenensis subsp. rotundata]